MSAFPAWLPAAIVLAPFAVAGLVLAGGRRLAPIADKLVIATMAAAFAGALCVALPFLSGAMTVWQGPRWTWLAPGGGIAFAFGTYVDPLAAVMLLVVTGLATLVALYSTWYLHDDDHYPRFFWQFALFCGAMLAIVASDNLLMSFVGWELVGLGSYLLIGFWGHKPAVADDARWQAMKPPGGDGTVPERLSPAHAQLKAFVVNRVGDFGFLAGLALFAWVAVAAGVGGQGLGWESLAALRTGDAFARVELAGLSGGTLLTLACLGVFLGAVGKSAQFPLHTWLPDAMQGPTTASSIIHAATMVAAGVFLVARLYPVLTPEALVAVQWTGAVTCLLAASMACTQWDLKGVLAYSTISQLGYMMLALGCGPEAGGWAAGITHLFTHAMFKCLLFLGAAAVIHACDGNQALHRCGGLARRMPVTAAATLVAVAAIAGLPFFSGFHSKDGVLAAALLAAEHHGGWAWAPFAMGLATAVLTAWYMTRWWVRIFLGAPRDPHLAEHAHDPWPRAQAVLIILALLSLQAAWTGSLNPLAGHGWVDRVLRAEAPAGMAHAHHLVAALASAGLVAGAGLSLWAFWWRPRRGLPVPGPGPLAPLAAACRNLWGLDRLYDRVFVQGFGQRWARTAAEADLGDENRLAALDGKPSATRWLPSLDAIIDLVARMVAEAGHRLGELHDGRIGTYLAWGALAVLILVLGVLR